eukprot:14912946-Alexandrium_andersonii.AAC.1
MCIRDSIRGEPAGEVTYSFARRPYGSPPGSPPVRYVKTVVVFLAAGPAGDALPAPSGVLRA